MRILESTTKMPLSAAVLVGDEDGTILVVDERGRLSGILITESDIRRAWRAARGARLDDATGTARQQRDLGLSANDVSLFFVHENGVVQQRIPDDRGDGAPLSLGGALMLGLGAFLWHARTGQRWRREVTDLASFTLERGQPARPPHRGGLAAGALVTPGAASAPGTLPAENGHELAGVAHAQA